MVFQESETIELKSVVADDIAPWLDEPCHKHSGTVLSYSRLLTHHHG